MSSQKNLMGSGMPAAQAKMLGYITNAGSPVSSVTPQFIGQVLFDTSNSVWYRSTGTTNTAWAQSGDPALSAAELALLDGVTAGTAIASKAVTTDASINVAGLNVVGLARIDLDSATATLSSNAATITKWSAVITTESLNTAHTATQALVITKTGVAAGDIAIVTRVGGTNAGGIPEIRAVCTTDTVTITLKNMAKSSDAFDGTFILNLIVFKA